MPIVLYKKYDITGQYKTETEKLKLIEMIDSFRTLLNDFEPDLNLLNGKKLQYSDSMVVRFLKEGLKDLNRGYPKTNYTLYTFPDPDLVVRGAVVTALIAEGILQLRNQVDYSDSGFSIAMFNKTGSYQSWAGFFLQSYMQDKREFKSGVIPRSNNAGFVSITSEFGWGHY